MDSTFDHRNSWHSSLPDELIFRYLKGLLSEKEKQAVEKEVAADPFLAESLEGWKQQLNAPHAQHVYQKLKRTIQQKAYHKNYRRWMTMTYISALTIAAIIAAAVVVTKIIEQHPAVKNPNENPTSATSSLPPDSIQKPGLSRYAADTVFERYHITIVDSLLNEQLDNDIPNVFSLRPALMRFQMGQYDTAMILIDKVIHTEPANHLAWYYGGICQIILNHPVAATRMLLNPSLGEESERHEAAMWYVGLVKLKIGSKGECTEIMQLITQHGDIYVKPANDLLKKLGEE